MIQEPGYRLNVGLIIINDNGKLLLCKRKNMNSWQFPQGGIDEGETPSRASKRELFEEVGIKSNYVKLVGSMSCLLYTSPSPRDRQKCRMPSSA